MIVRDERTRPNGSRSAAYRGGLLALVVAVTILAGCGDNGSGDTSSATTPSDTSVATTSTGSTSAEASLCASIAQLKTEATQITQTSDVSASQLAGDVAQVTGTVGDISGSAAEVAGQVGSDVKDAVATFESQISGITSGSVADGLTTLGTALGQLEDSLSATASQINCGG